MLSRSLRALNERRKLMLLGSGWSAYRVLKNIDESKFHVCVVSPRNHFIFTPLLCSAALGTLNVRSICEPVRKQVAKKRGQYYQAEAVRVDKNKKLVYCRTDDESEFPLSYDNLVICVGFRVNTFGLDLEKTAFFMKESWDSLKFNIHIHNLLERVSNIHALDGDLEYSEKEKVEIRKLLTLVIAGAGPTGVEFAGELTDFLQLEAAKTYPKLKDFFSVHLVSGALLQTYSTKMQNYAGKHLNTRQNVNIHLNTFVKSNTSRSSEYGDFPRSGTLVLSTGESIDYGSLIWCGGIRALPFTESLEMKKTENGAQLLTQGNMLVHGETDIFALGDCQKSSEQPGLPQTAQVANQQGQYLARHLNEEKAPEYWPKFEFKSQGMMTYLGGGKAMLESPSTQVTGEFAYYLWRVTYWSLQISNRNRYSVVADWIRNYLFGRDMNSIGN